jgi:hypothetical protein
VNAVWMIRSHQILHKMRFWIAIIGYDPRDRSTSQRIYLVYVIIFFSLWGFAMAALSAEPMVWVLTRFKGYSPIQIAIIISITILILDFLLRSYRYSKYSPFKFSKEDAALICQTPVDRRQVALAWLFGDWIPAGIIYFAYGVIISFACQQLLAVEGINWPQLPYYILMGLRLASILLALSLAYMATAYIIGALRLRRDKDVLHLRLIPIGIGAGLLIFVIFTPSGLGIVLWPTLYPLEAGFNTEVWVIGFVLAIFLATLSLLVLYLITPELNLSRAAQETSSSKELQEV